MTRIAIVEDNKVIRESLVEFVQADPECRCVCACATAEEALKVIPQQQPEIVLMDIQLPDIDGITALRRLRADPLTQKTPVVAVSASVMPDDQQRIVASGFDAYITKPINVKSFVETVERFIGKPQGK